MPPTCGQTLRTTGLHESITYSSHVEWAQYGKIYVFLGPVCFSNHQLLLWLHVMRSGDPVYIRIYKIHKINTISLCVIKSFKNEELFLQKQLRSSLMYLLKGNFRAPC